MSVFVACCRCHSWFTVELMLGRARLPKDLVATRSLFKTRFVGDKCYVGQVGALFGPARLRNAERGPRCESPGILQECAPPMMGFSHGFSTESTVNRKPPTANRKPLTNHPPLACLTRTQCPKRKEPFRPRKRRHLSWQNLRIPSTPSGSVRRPPIDPG
jgi:hypothetical protein